MVAFPKIKVQPDYFFFFLPLPIILFYILAFVGCLSTSPGIPNLHLVSLTRNGNDTGEIHVRIGYFGLCLTTPASSITCSSTTGQTRDSLVQRLLPTTLTQPTNSSSSSTSPRDAALATSAADLVATARILQSDIFGAAAPVASAVLFVLGLAGLLVLGRMLRRARRRAAADEYDDGLAAAGRPYVIVRRAVLSLLWASMAVALMSALATTQTAAALQYAGSVLFVGPTGGSSGSGVGRGVSVEALLWVAASLEMLFVLRVSYLHKAEGLVVKREVKGEV